MTACAARFQKNGGRPNWNKGSNQQLPICIAVAPDKILGLSQTY